MSRLVSQPADARTTPGLRERGKLRRIERILEAGLELLREDPEQNLTIERLAERAEVAPMTVYNLIGGRDQLWTALVDRALKRLDIDVAAADPQDRARRIVGAYVDTLRADPLVFRALFSGWTNASRTIIRDPTAALTACLEEAAALGQIDPAVDIREHGEIMSSALLGSTHLWTAGLLSDRRFAARTKALVDLVFAAARFGPGERPR